MSSVHEHDLLCLCVPDTHEGVHAGGYHVVGIGDTPYLVDLFFCGGLEGGCDKGGVDIEGLRTTQCVLVNVRQYLKILFLNSIFNTAKLCRISKETFLSFIYNQT